MSSNVSAQTLEEALDISGYTFTTGGTSNWTGQTAESSDGVDAAVSGTLPENSGGTTWLMVEVNLPVVVKFKWKTSSHTVNGYFQTSTTGQSNASWKTVANIYNYSTDWTEREIFFSGSGKLYLRWSSESSYSHGNISRLIYLDTLSIQAINEVSQKEALDAPDLVIESNFSAGGSNAWIGQTNVSQDGVDALLSPTSNTERSWIQTKVDGPAEVSFYWKAITGSNDYPLTLESPATGGENDVIATLRTTASWEKVNVIIPAGTHTLRWVKNTNSSYNNSNGAGLVDKLEVAPITNTVSINEAVDNSELAFTTNNGRWAWFGRQINGAEGGDALTSPTFGYSGNDIEPAVETTVRGPVSLSFRWKLDTANSNSGYSNELICSLAQANAANQNTWIRAATLSNQNSAAAGQWREEFIQVPAGEWQVKWHILNPSYYSNSDFKSTVAYLDKVRTEGLSTVSLNEALDTNDFIFSTSSNELGWFGLPGLGENGTDAAQSSIVANGQQSWIRTYVTGPGTLFYRWKGSNSYSYNYRMHLAWDRFLSPKYGIGKSISGNNTWQSDSVYIPKGTYLIEWVLQNNSNNGDTLNVGYLNQVSFTSAEATDLGEALDAPYLEWTSGSEAEGIEWHGQSTTTSDLQDAAMSPFVPYGETAWIQTQVRGPGVLRFKTKLPYDNYNSTTLSLYQAQESENPQWNQVKQLRADSYGSNGYNSNTWYTESVTIPHGVNYLAWQIERGSGNSYSGGSAYREPHAYLDNVQFEHTGLWAGAVPVGKDLSYSPWYGFIYLTDGGWIYHFHHGWQWFYSNDAGNIWLYDLAMGWLWTTKDFYPSLFHAESGKILLYEKESHNPRRFQDTTTNEWMEIE